MGAQAVDVFEIRYCCMVLLSNLAIERPSMYHDINLYIESVTWKQLMFARRSTGSRVASESLVLSTQMIISI